MTKKPILYVNNNNFTEVLLGYIFKQVGFTIKEYTNIQPIRLDKNNILINNYNNYNHFTEDIKSIIELINQNKDNMLFLIGYDYSNYSNSKKTRKRKIDEETIIINEINYYIKTGEDTLNSFENLFDECLLPINDTIMYYNLEFINKLTNKVKDSENNDYFTSLFSEKKYEIIVALLVSYTNNFNLESTRIIAVYINDNNPDKVKILLRPYRNTNTDIDKLGKICCNDCDDIQANINVEKFDKFIEEYKKSELNIDTFIENLN